MIEYYAIRGHSEKDHLWCTFIVLKATDKKEAVELLDQWLESHTKGNEYTTIKINVIRAWEFKNFSRQEKCRAFISKTAEETTKITKTTTQTKQQMLQGSP